MAKSKKESLNLQDYLKKNRLSYREFAKELGYTFPTLSNVIHGENCSFNLYMAIKRHTHGIVTDEKIAENFEKNKLNKNLKKDSTPDTTN